MSRLLYKLLYSGIAALLFSSAVAVVSAQSIGTIRGTVLDQSGASVPHASIVITDAATNIKRTEATNENGIFVFSHLPIGSYSIKTLAPGFAAQGRTGLQLVTGQSIDLSIALTVGGQSTEVTVTSEAQQIETITSNISQSVTQEQMRDLPLNGRNPLQLTTLTAGTVLTTTGTESGQEDNTGLSVNGLRATQNTYTLDGSIYVNRFFDSVPTMPNPDALQEFTIQASNYSADHAGAGALVQLSTRSGSKEYHGDAWEYFRKAALNARNYFWSASKPRPPFKLNQFGGTIGGPIPKLKNAFFFFSAEDLQQRSAPTPISVEVPTAAELTGDFSTLATQGVALYNPTTGCGYGQTGTSVTGCSRTITDKISTSMDSLSSAVNKQYLAAVESVATQASTGAYSTYSSNTNSNIDSTQYLARIDDEFTTRDHISGRYFYNQDNFQRPFSAPIGFYAANLFRNQSLALSETHEFSDTTTGSLTFGFYRGARIQISEAPGLKTLQDLGQSINYGSPNESLLCRLCSRRQHGSPNRRIEDQGMVQPGSFPQECHRDLRRYTTQLSARSGIRRRGPFDLQRNSA